MSASDKPLKMVTCSGCEAKVFIPGDLPPLATEPCKRCGHPAVIDWKHVAGIRALPQGEGLNRYFRQQQAETLEVPVESADVLCDLDTPEEYERLRRRWQER